MQNILSYLSSTTFVISRVINSEILIINPDKNIKVADICDAFCFVATNKLNT